MAAVTLLSGATANGPGSALDCRNAKKASFVITGTFDAAINFKFSQDGTNYYPFTGLVNEGVESSVTYSAGHVLFDVEPVAYIMPDVSAYKSGSITVTGYVDDSKVTSVQVMSNNEQVYDGSVSWANSAAAGTTNNIDVALPSALQNLYLISVTNPSTESALTVKVLNKETLGGSAKYPELTRFSVAVNSPDGKSVLVQGWLLGEAGRLVLSNDTALGASGGFTAYVRVRKV